jgi:prolyl-tRNA synthetase
MAKDKKMVEQITSMDEDFAKWYTDIVIKADLIDYSSVKGCMIIRPYGSADTDPPGANFQRGHRQFPS